MGRLIEAKVEKIIKITSNAIPYLSGSQGGKGGYYRIYLKSDYLAAYSVPGQFINVKCGLGNDLILRRPFSICGVDRINKSINFAFRVKGKGTDLLTETKAGDILDVMGPLGTGFSILPEYHRMAVVGGGIGIFPLIFLLDELHALKNTPNISVYAGFKDNTARALFDMLGPLSHDVCIATEDGCKGIKGLITKPLEEGLNEKGFDVIYACGPAAMLAEVASLAAKYKCRCQVSFEERMGCGIGACMVCSCKMNSGDGDWKYGRVCKDGPVFWTSDLII